MLYSVAEISVLTNLSKVTIYKKLKKKELAEHIVKKGGIAYIDEIGLNLIKNNLNLNDDIKINLNNRNVISDVSEEIALDMNIEDLSGLIIKTNPTNKTITGINPKDEMTITRDDLNIKTDFINTLKEQLKVKDDQIQELNNRLQQEQELHQNTQVLFKGEQERPKDVLVLRRDRKKKGFWKRLLNLF